MLRWLSTVSILAAFLAAQVAAQPAMPPAVQPGIQHAGPPSGGSGDHDDLVALNEELRRYMVPGFTNAVVLDSGARVGEQYGAALLAEKLAGLTAFETRLRDMNAADWSRPQQVDWLVVTSLLNGYRYNLSVLQPWARDPGFYLDPLMRIAFAGVGDDDPAARQALRGQLRAVPPMLGAARGRLDHMAGDFVDLALHNLENSDGVNHYHPYRAVPPAGIIGWYDDLAERARRGDPALLPDVEAARAALVSFRDWLAAQRPGLPQNAGVGAARYDWYMRHVRMLPYSADEMLTLAGRELERLTAERALVRHRTRGLPAIPLSASAAEQEAKIAETDARVRAFLDAGEILTVPAGTPEFGANTPWIERPQGPNFWEQVQFRNPVPDHLHAVIPGHRFDTWLAGRSTDPVRADFSDGVRAEGWATYLEEAMTTAGALEYDPRAEALIDLFGMFRAARVPADIHMQRNDWSVAEAVEAMRANTPWLDRNVARVDAEIYLRRAPGYGLAYTIGKLQMDALLADAVRSGGDDFVLRDFHDRFLAAGRLPISLIRYEMLGDPAGVAPFWRTPPIPAVQTPAN